MAAGNNSHIAQQPLAAQCSLVSIFWDVSRSDVCTSQGYACREGARPPLAQCHLSTGWNADGRESSWIVPMQRDTPLSSTSAWLAYAYEGEGNLSLLQPLLFHVL